MSELSDNGKLFAAAMTDAIGYSLHPKSRTSQQNPSLVDAIFRTPLIRAVAK